MVISPVLNTCSPLQYCPSLDPCCSPAISGFGLKAVCGYCNFCTACDDSFGWPREELDSAEAFLAPTEALVVAAAFLVVSWLDLVARDGLAGSVGAPLRGLDPVAGFEPDAPMASPRAMSFLVFRPFGGQDGMAAAPASVAAAQKQTVFKHKHPLRGPP